MEKQPDRIIPKGYAKILKEIKEKIKSSQLKAAVAVNRELIKLYWEIGRVILEKKEKEGWGAKTIEKLARDLKISFPGMKGFSLRNLQFMTQFSREYPDIQIVKQVVSQIPWGHNILIIQMIDKKEERVWYAKKTIENGWSRSNLTRHLKSSLYHRQGKSISNFQITLPRPQSDLAEQTLKDPYHFEFLSLREKYEEKELEEGLLDHIQKFLIELGTGFAFVGRQYKIAISNKEYYLDLIFYHLNLSCFCVIELKSKEFDPRDAGQMSFYLSAVDDLLRRPGDNPTIGMILCKTKDNVTVEYALRGSNKPIGVSGYETKILGSLPENLKGSLPTIEEIEQELETVEGGSMKKGEENFMKYAVKEKIIQTKGSEDN